MRHPERTIRKLRRELAAVEPPPEAKQLRALLLELLDREVALAQEVAQLGSFVPHFAAALHPLAAADAALKAALAQTAKGKAATKALDARKATALETYAATLESVIGNVRALHPPPVWEPGYGAQLSALGQLRSSGLALAQAIRANRAGAIPTLLHRFDLAAVADQSVAVQKREVAAVQAYDARITALRALARKIELERVRLQRAYA